MLTIKYTTSYKKSYKLMKKRGLDLSLLDEVVDALIDIKKPGPPRCISAKRTGTYSFCFFSHFL